MFRFLFFISLVFALGILIFSCSGSVEEDRTAVEEDRAALIALYNATDGDNWKDNTNWLSNKPLKEWSGVRINGQGRVDMLVLHENFLSGAIPPELGNLSIFKRCLCTATGSYLVLYRQNWATCQILKFCF